MLLSALPVLLLQTFLGAQVSAELGIRAESRAGLLPTGIRTTDLTGDFSAATSLALLAANPRGRAGLIYSPQVSTRTGTGSSMLFFHRGALESSYRLTSRLGVSADVRGEIGEVDLLDIASIVERGPAGLPFLPETTKVRYRAASGNLGLSYRATERLGLDLNGGVSELVPMGNADDTLLQSQIAAQVGLSGRYQVNPRHSAGLSVEGSIVDFRAGAYYQAITAAARTEHRLGRTVELSTRLGAWFALAEFPPAESVIWNPGQGTLTPEDLLTRHPHMVVGDISLASRLWSTQGVVSRGRLGASVAPFFDPFRGIQEPRATVSAESEWVLRGDTEIEARGEWSTSAYALSSERPLGRSGDEVVTLSLSVSHPLRADMHIEAGLRSGFHVNRESADSLRRQEISASLALVGRLQRWSSH